MDMQLVLAKLKKEYINNAQKVDVTHVNHVIKQIKNITNTNKEQIGKTLNEVTNAKQRILELSEALGQMDASNIQISEDMSTLEERLISVERDNWKYKQHSEGDQQRAQILSAENKNLLRNFIEQEEGNGKLKKRLGELNQELNSISVFIDKMLENEKKLWQVLIKIRETQRDIEKVQKSVLDKGKYETASKNIGVLTSYYKNKLERIEQERVVILNEFDKWKIEYDTMKNTINKNSSEASGLVAKMFTSQFKENYEFFQKNLEDQEMRLERLTELSKEESEINSRLTLLLKSRTEENNEARDVTKDIVEVKDEIVFMENSN